MPLKPLAGNFLDGCTVHLFWIVFCIVYVSLSLLKGRQAFDIGTTAQGLSITVIREFLDNILINFVLSVCALRKLLVIPLCYRILLINTSKYVFQGHCQRWAVCYCVPLYPLQTLQGN
jgi:hypothetical protein